MNIDKLKKTGIITGAVFVSLYVIFLLLPLILSPILNSYNIQISNMLEEATGYKYKLEKIGVVTTLNLTAGIKAKRVEVSVPTGEKFLSADNLSLKLSILPIIFGQIQIDSVSVENLKTNLGIRPDGKFIIEEFLPQPDPDKHVAAMQPLPLGIKLSNHLPDILVKNYNLAFVDINSKKEYTIKGKKISISDFILDKKIRVIADGEVVLDSAHQITYDIKVFNKLMPELSLNDMVFSPQPQPESTPISFNIIDLFKALNSTKLTADLSSDMKIYGEFNNPRVNGTFDVKNLSMLVDGKILPSGAIEMKAKGNKINLGIDLYTAENEKTILQGKFKTGKNPNLDMQFKSNAKFNNLFRILNSLAKSFNYKDLETLSATGGIDADFRIKSNMKRVTSDGYFKIPLASINYKLFNVTLQNIKADIDLKNNGINIKDVGLQIMGQPLKIYGTIANNSETDINIKADKLLLKGLVAAAGQVQLLKENTFSSGTLSLDASLKGKLTKLVPSVDLLIDDINIHNIPSNTRMTLPVAKLVINTNGKKFSGDLTTSNLRIVNPMVVVTVPETDVKIGEQDISIQKAYVLLNNSRIDITGKIENYINDKMSLDIKAKGNLFANDIKTMIPKEMRYIISGAVGKLPLDVELKGNLKTQDISFKLLANPSNYITIIDTNLLRGKTTLVNSNIRLSDNTLKLTNTGIFATDISAPIVLLTGAVNNLSSSQDLNMRLAVPKRVSIVIPGFKKSNLTARGDIDITGTALNPYMKGLVSVPSITIPDMALVMNNLVANINGPVLKGNATLQNFQSGGIVAENIATEFSLKNYTVFYLNNMVADAFKGKVSGDISYGIDNGRINVKIKGSDMDAVSAIEGVSGIKNALSGKLAFDANISTKGSTDVDMMRYLAGNAKFSVVNGKFMNVGRFDNLLYAQNIMGNVILKSVVTSITNLPMVQNTAEFKSIDGAMNFGNGWAKISYIKTTGPLMAYFINGRYNLLNGTTNVIILGRLDSKVVALLGPLGDLSVEKLTSYIPKFGTLTGMLINSLTSDPEKENTANIPALSGGSSNYKDFKVEFNGGIESKTSIKSFKWLTKCDTSAIDLKQEFTDAKDALKNSVQNAKQNLQDTKDVFKNTIQDSKQQLEDLKNLFKI